MNSVFKLLIIVAAFSFVSCNNDAENDEKATALNNEGISYYNANQLDKAILTYKKAVSLQQVSNTVKVGILRNLAQAYIQKSEIDSAVKFLNVAVSLSKPNSYNYYINSADKLLLRDSTYEALVLLEKAEKLNKEDMGVSNMLGLIYLGQYGVMFKNANKALTYNRKAYAINHDRNAGYVLALNYFALERYGEAKTILVELNQKYPNIADLHFLLGKCHYHLYNQASGDIAFDKVIDIDPDYKETVEDFKVEFNNKKDIEIEGPNVLEMEAEPDYVVPQK